MTKKPSLSEVRSRVRTLETPQLILMAGAFGNVEFAAGAPQAAVARFEAMRDEAVAELERRGIVVVPDPDMVCQLTYGGDVPGI